MKITDFISLKSALLLPLAFTACSVADDASIRTLTFEEMLEPAITLTDANGEEFFGASVNIEFNDDTTGESTDGTIFVNGFTNVCSNPPCTDAELQEPIGRLTITGMSDTFTLAEDAASNVIDIPDQEGAASISGNLGNIVITRTSDKALRTYAVIVQYSGTLVTEIVDNAGGFVNVISPAMAPMASATLGYQATTTAVWDEEVLVVTDMVNLPGDTAMGTVSVTASELPAGYYVMPYTYTDPAGTKAVALMGTLTIAEGDENTLSVAYENQASYDNLRIELTEAPDLAITPQDLIISVTNTLNNDIVLDAGHFVINYNHFTVTITDATIFHNLNGAELSLSSGSLSLSGTENSAFDIDAANITTVFTDPIGTEAITTNLNTFSVTKDAISIDYSLYLTFASTYNFELDSEVIADMETGVSAPFVIAACDNPTSSIFTIATDGTTNYFANVSGRVNYYYNSAIDANNTNTIVLTADDGSSLDFTGAIAVQKCDSFAGGDGSAGNPWQIDNDMQLDLMSRLINNDDAATATYSDYGDDAYILTANIDMSIPEAPWAEGSLHPNANTNGFIPIGKSVNPIGLSVSHQSNSFKGQLNCEANNTRYAIANLYINNTNDTAAENTEGVFIGLFSVLTNGAVITNCTLENASITGYQIVGGIAGYAYSSNNENISIGSNIVANSSITANSSRVGSIVGVIYSVQNSSIVISSNAVTNGNVSTGNSYAGGIIGASTSSGTSTNTISGNTVTDGSITADNDNAGGITGYVASSGGNTIVSMNTVTGGSVTVNDDNAGGIVGYIHSSQDANSTISGNTVANGNITASNNFVGGIAGYMYSGERGGGTLSNNVVTNGTISVSFYDAGGIAGVMYSTSFGSNALNDNVVTNSSITADNTAGGIVGDVYSLEDGSNIISTNNISGGSITANISNAGGIVGFMYSENASKSNVINAAFAATTITASNGNAGGVVGYILQGGITNSFFMGTISADSGTVGGVVGFVTDTTSTITNSYAAAIVTGIPDTSYGLVPTSVTVNHSYYNSTLHTGAADSAEGTVAQSHDVLRYPRGSRGIYANWDEASWDFGTDDQYPMLRGLPLTASEQCGVADAALTSVTFNCGTGTGDTGYDD